jgi:RNA 2',3'-cyclic 3'-phosphodiesterase
MRLFVALELPDTWRAAALEVRAVLESALDDSSARALRWVDPALLHLTLRFLGEFPDTEVPRLQAALDAIDPFDLELALAGAGGFGGRNRLQVVWLRAASARSPARSPAARVECACSEAGARPEARAFRPHVTLARVRERAPADARRALAAAIEALPPASEPRAFRAREVALVRSYLGEGPTRYEVLSRHPRKSGDRTGLSSLLAPPKPADSEGRRNVDGLDGPA